ncbi:MAG: hypothetical protein B6244_13975 [Candidatus Cloacimonetes bacterium 4572_55]|nr:MAG: hypothetical protein B6244_13975 [Candidatus Cloacimonetes bacterium 4572_55]
MLLKKNFFLVFVAILLLSIPVISGATPVITEGDSVGVTVAEDAAVDTVVTLHATGADSMYFVWTIIDSAGMHGVADTAGTGTGSVADSCFITYAPSPGYSGVDSFFVRVVDSSGDADTIKVTVTVTPNNPPVITEVSPINVTVAENAATANVDTLHATDAEGNTLTWSIATAAINGTAGAGAGSDSSIITYTS